MSSSLVRLALISSREERALESNRGSSSIPKLKRSRILPSGSLLQSQCTTTFSDEHVQDYLIRSARPYPRSIGTPFLSDPFPSKYVGLYLERYASRLSVRPDREKKKNKKNKNIKKKASQIRDRRRKKTKTVAQIVHFSFFIPSLATPNKARLCIVVVLLFPAAGQQRQDGLKHARIHQQQWFCNVFPPAPRRLFCAPVFPQLGRDTPRFVAFFPLLPS